MQYPLHKNWIFSLRIFQKTTDLLTFTEEILHFSCSDRIYMQNFKKKKVKSYGVTTTLNSEKQPEVLLQNAKAYLEPNQTSAMVYSEL